MNRHFVLIHPTGEATPRSLNIVVLKKFFDSLPRGVEYVKRRTNGDIIVFVSPDNTALLSSLCNTKIINDVQVEIQVPAEASLLRGVITHSEISFLTEDDLKELLQDRQVHAVKKITQDTAVVAWHRKVIPEGLPSHIILGWETVKVRPYVRRPVRCYFCQQYGHVASSCMKKKPVCSRCANQGHTKEECEATQPKCAACEGPHETSDPTCNKWKEECQISKIKQENNISYKAALMKLRQPTPPTAKQQQQEIQLQHTQPGETMDHEDHQDDFSSEEETATKEETSEDDEEKQEERSTPSTDQELSPATKKTRRELTVLEKATFLNIEAKKELAYSGPGPVYNFNLDSIVRTTINRLRPSYLNFLNKFSTESQEYLQRADLVQLYIGVEEVLFQAHLNRALTVEEINSITECNSHGQHVDCWHQAIRKEMFKNSSYK